MRQLDKPGRPESYDFDVDVHGGQADLDDSLREIKIPFTREPLKAQIEQAFHTHEPTALQIARALLGLYKNQPPANFTAVLAGKVKKKLSESYAQAAGPLEEGIGRYCSYCEGFFLAGLAVEHIAAKAPYPSFYLAWSNFLLACPSCNSIKGEQPPPTDQIFRPPPRVQIYYYDRIKLSYCWPQWDRRAFQEQPLVLECKVNRVWELVPLGPSVDPQTVVVRTNHQRRRIYANIGNLHADVRVRVKVTNITDGAKKNIELVKLNRRSSNRRRRGGEADIRMWSRTMSWFRVLAVLRLLQASQTRQEFEDKWTVMMNMIESVGFYSVWVTVIARLGPDESWTVPGQNRKVMRRFLAEIPTKFPGTNIRNTP